MHCFSIFILNYHLALNATGDTVTGLVEIDLNSPEPNPAVYGPWPVNRVVRGPDGNALLRK